MSEVSVELTEALKILMNQSPSPKSDAKPFDFAAALASAESDGVARGMEQAAALHDAEVERLNAQIAENTEYCKRTGKNPHECDSNRFCLNMLHWHDRQAAAIRAAAIRLRDHGGK